MTNLGNHKDSSDSYLKHYNKIVDSFDQDFKNTVIQNSSQKSRVRVGRVDDKVFVEPEKTRRKVVKKKFLSILKENIIASSLSSKILSLMLLLGVVRLIVMDHGIVNYFEKESILHDRYRTIEQLKMENLEIAKEINRAKNDVKYQKNLAREQLGVISSEEYLILFAPKEKTPSK